MDLNEGITVLSCFDGMSCGMIALDRLGIKVKAYYASEVDKPAIKVSKHNWPNIIHIGDVTKVGYFEGWLYTENGDFYVGKIDLLIGGSPCQGFSFAGKQLNFEDPRSKLFFEYVRLLRETEAEYFMLENVVMRKEYENVISGILKISPICINSALVSMQNRKRLYWTNIPFSGQPIDKGILFKNNIDTHELNYRYLHPKTVERSINNKWSRCIRYDADKLPTILHNQKKQSTDSISILLQNGKRRWLSPIESEIAQTVPIGYTSIVSFGDRNGMLGNGWNVDTVCHLFEPLLYVV